MTTTNILKRQMPSDIAEVLRLMNSLQRSLNLQPVRREPVQPVLPTAAELAAIAKSHADAELREEVIEAMVDAGIARHVAANRTNTEQKMLVEARAFEII